MKEKNLSSATLVGCISDSETGLEDIKKWFMSNYDHTRVSFAICGSKQKLT